MLVRGVRAALGCAGDGLAARNMSRSAPVSSPFWFVCALGKGLPLSRAERARSGEGVRGMRCRGGEEAMFDPTWKLITGRSSSSCSDVGDGDLSATVLVSDMKDRRGTCASLYRT